MVKRLEAHIHTSDGCIQLANEGRSEHNAVQHNVLGAWTEHLR